MLEALWVASGCACPGSQASWQTRVSSQHTLGLVVLGIVAGARVPKPAGNKARVGTGSLGSEFQTPPPDSSYPLECLLSHPLNCHWA